MNAGLRSSRECFQEVLEVMVLITSAISIPQFIFLLAALNLIPIGQSCSSTFLYLDHTKRTLVFTGVLAFQTTIGKQVYYEILL